MRAAYDELDDATKEQLQGLSAYHSLYHSQSKLGYTHATDNQYGFHDKGAPLRPVIKTHPETGRKSLYTGRHAYGIPGMSDEESEAFLAKLLDDACQPPRTYRHSWTVGDLVVWGQPLRDAPSATLRPQPHPGTAGVADLRRARVRVGTDLCRSPGGGIPPVIDERVVIEFSALGLSARLPLFLVDTGPRGEGIPTRSTARVALFMEHTPKGA